MVLILVAAVAIAFLTWWVDGARGFPAHATIILAIVIANAFLGFLQEYGAERAIEELQKSTATKARVRRDGQIVSVDQEELVPGDIILLSEGDKIPADAILINASHLLSNESMLKASPCPSTNLPARYPLTRRSMPEAAPCTPVAPSPAVKLPR